MRLPRMTSKELGFFNSLIVSKPINQPVSPRHRYQLFERDNADDRLITSARLLGELFDDIEELGHSEWLIRDCWRDRWINPDEFWLMVLEAQEPVTA